MRADYQTPQSANQVHKLTNNATKRIKPTRATSESLIECKFCGKKHRYGRVFCPAYGKQCSRCHGRNHFSIKCKQTINQVDHSSFLFKFFSFAFYHINFWFKVSKICPKISYFSQISHSSGTHCLRVTSSISL